MIATCLKGKKVFLEPLEDNDYFIELAYKNNKYEYSQEQISTLLKVYDYELWSVVVNGTRRGVAGYLKVKGVYVLEALKDDSKPRTGISYSIEVGNLILNYLFDITNEVITFARLEDKAVQILCIKLGFKEIRNIEILGKNFILYKKEKSECQQ